MKTLRALLVLAISGLVLISCSSAGSASRPQIGYGMDGVQIARQLGVCAHPEKAGKHGARCRFPDGQLVLVDPIAGPADQKLAIPTAKQVDTFCDLIGHGYDIVGIGYTGLRRHVRVNQIVAKYGGRIVGGGC